MLDRSNGWKKGLDRSNSLGIVQRFTVIHSSDQVLTMPDHWTVLVPSRR